jgi:RimJ/RimL family protein N-acetyltransferase
MLMKEIRTERLLIKTPEIDDKFELTQLINDKNVIKWLSEIPFPYTIGHAEEFIERSQEEVLKQESYNFMIFQDRKMLGGIGLRDFNKNSCELGYWLGKKYWGNGFASEAVNGILDFGFDQLNLEEIYAAYKITNEGSKRVLEKCGFEFFREKKEFDSLLLKEESLIEMIKK